MNTLLLADELRSIVLKEAFNKDCNISDSFEWDVLNYPTVLSSNQNATKLIKNLEQLKIAVSIEEKETEEKKKKKIAEKQQENNVESTSYDNVNNNYLIIIFLLF